MRLEDLPPDLGDVVRVPVTDNSRLAVVLAVSLSALAIVSFVVVDDEDPTVIYIIAGFLLTVGVCFGALAAAQLRHRPRELILDTDTLSIPALPWWRGPQQVPLARLAGLGETVIPNIGPALAFRLDEDGLLQIPYSSLPAASLEALIRRIDARRSRVANGDPPETLAGYEALALVSGQNAVAVVAGGRVIALEPDMGAYAASRERHPADHRLVTGRPAPAAALGVDAATVEAMLDQVATAGPPGHLDRRNLALFAEDGVYELFSLLRKLALLPVGERPPAVADHFARLAEARREADALMETARDLDAVRERLRIELDDATRTPAGLVTRPLCDEVQAVLVLDHLSGTTPVGRDLAEHWDVPDDVLFAAAVENLRGLSVQQEPRDAYTVHLGDDSTAARLLFDVPAGAVVAVPARDVLMVMESAIGLLAAGQMLLDARTVHGRAARPVRPELFVWWRDRLNPVGVQEGPDGKLVLVPPGDVFGEILRQHRGPPA